MTTAHLARGVYYPANVIGEVVRLIENAVVPLPPHDTIVARCILFDKQMIVGKPTKCQPEEIDHHLSGHQTDDTDELEVLVERLLEEGIPFITEKKGIYSRDVILWEVEPWG